jgi:hypothetical protein
MHSHGKLEPGFSGIDDRDDAGGIKICVVFGDYRDSGPEGGQSFAYLIRFVVEGFFIDAEFRWNGEERLWVR